MNLEIRDEREGRVLLSAINRGRRELERVVRKGPRGSSEEDLRILQRMAHDVAKELPPRA